MNYSRQRYGNNKKESAMVIPLIPPSTIIFCKAKSQPNPRMEFALRSFNESNKGRRSGNPKMATMPIPFPVCEDIPEINVRIPDKPIPPSISVLKNISILAPSSGLKPINNP